MNAPRFFVQGTHEPGDRVTLEGADAHKITAVLRLREGAMLEIIDSAANAFTAIVLDERASRVHALLQDRLDTADDGSHALRITIAQGIPKGQKMDFIVEKLTELGVAEILPFESERSVVIAGGANKIERWRRLAKTAAQQCGRREIPSVANPCSLRELIPRFAEFDSVLVPWELAPRRPLRDTLPALTGSARNVLALVGPEGGFSHAEAESAVAAGARLISLGTRILRTETAGVALIVALGYASGEL